MATPQCATHCAFTHSPYNTLHYGLIAMEEKTERVDVHLGSSILKILDKWRRKRRDLPSRAEAIRLLVERGLAGNTTTARQLGKRGRRKAAELASREIDRLGDQTVTNEERTRRKRRLIKGPREFRDLRADRPKTKS
jgi:Arc/MetJ-type ribon-helix-helix transcriptional regulator